VLLVQHRGDTPPQPVAKNTPTLPHNTTTARPHTYTPCLLSTWAQVSGADQPTNTPLRMPAGGPAHRTPACSDALAQGQAVVHKQGKPSTEHHIRAGVPLLSRSEDTGANLQGLDSHTAQEEHTLPAAGQQPNGCATHQLSHPHTPHCVHCRVASSARAACNTHNPTKSAPAGDTRQLSLPLQALTPAQLQTAHVPSLILAGNLQTAEDTGTTCQQWRTPLLPPACWHVSRQREESAKQHTHGYRPHTIQLPSLLQPHVHTWRERACLAHTQHILARAQLTVKHTHNPAGEAAPGGWAASK
jgi:hypothetical protein